MADADAAGRELELRRRLEREVLVCDGAMGTMLTAAGASLDRCLPELSLSRPDLVRAIHRAYVSAGADIIETNTFLANRLALRRYGLEHQVERVNATSVELAREVCAEKGSAVLVGGSIGPAVSPRRASSVPGAEAVKALTEQVEALDRAGVDLLVFETFGDLAALVQAVRAAKEVSGRPVIAHVTFLEDGRTIAGDPPEAVAAALEELGVVALGANCTLGPRGLRSVVDQLARSTTVPLSVQPNAGPPTFVNGRFQYERNEEYFARAARRFVELGASIVGGCCGTTPRHIEAVAAAVRGISPGPREAEQRPTLLGGASVRPVAPQSGQFRTKLLGGEFVVGCELRLPEGSDPDAAVAEVELVREAGADTVLIASTASARVHISPVTFGLLVRERLGMDAILTATTWDKSMLGLQADLLGAHAFGLQTVLCRTGTPPPEGDYPNLSGVFDVTSIDLIEMLQSLNEARDHTGTRIRRATSFLIGARVNPVAVDLDEAVTRARRKIAAGAHFLVTEPVFDLSDLRRFTDALGEPSVPVLLGVMALRDYEHAEYLNYEVPGVRVPDELLGRLRRDSGPGVGLQIASELVWAASGLVQGVVVMPASGTARDGAELLGAVLGLAGAWPPRPPAGAPAPGAPGSTGAPETR